MSGGASPGRTSPQFLEGALSTDDFYPLPDYVASLIPPADLLVSFDRFVAEHGVGDEREEASYVAGPQGGSSVGVDEGGDQGFGSGIEGGGAEERGSAINDPCAEDLGSVTGGAHDLASGFGNDVAQEGSRGIGDAGVGYKKRFRGWEGSYVRVGPPREVGAVELALRNSSTRKTKYILEPVVGTSFDSLAEAHEFYNLYSWEVGFGIRYGKNYTNGKNYRSSQELICQLQGFDKRDKNDSARCGCKAMIRLHRSDDDGWFVETNRPDHNHLLSDNCGEKMQWNSHKKIDQATKDIVRYLRENNVSLSKVHCILGSMHKSGDRLQWWDGGRRRHWRTA